MFIQAPGMDYCSRRPQQQFNSLQPHISLSDKNIHELQTLLMLETNVSGVLVLTEKQTIAYVDEGAQKILGRLHHHSDQANPLPAEIWCVAQALIENQLLFPESDWRIESRLIVDRSTILRLQGRWLQLSDCDHPYRLLLFLEFERSPWEQALSEAQQCKLTAREVEVWLLYRANHTYRQIADKLYITLNTVKKHMKSIHAKRRSVFELDDFELKKKWA